MLAELDQVKKQYKDFTLDCSMKIQEDCVTGLIGANGAGKSTTFKMLLGLVRPDSGEIRIFGKNRKDLSENDRREIGTVLSDSFFFRIPDSGSANEFYGRLLSGISEKGI